MKIIDIPVYNDDGSVQFTQQVSPEEAKALLTFSINFLAAKGYHAMFGAGEDPEEEAEFND